MGTANNMAFAYTVRVIDKLGYEAATAESNQVRISYDQTIDADCYTITRLENGDIVIAAKEEQLLTTGGWKITGAQLPADGTYTVTITGESGQETVAKTGSFTDNENQSGETFLAYFNKPGVETSDTRIWMYDAAQVVITGVPDYVTLSDIHLLSYPGDNIAFTEGASIGVLERDYTYAIDGGQTETIPAGTVVVTGSYRGDPLYNSVRVVAQMQTMKPGSSEAPVVTKQTLSGETLLFAEIPEDGQVSTISDGFFLFVPENQEAFRQVNEDHGDNHAVGNSVMIALQAQMWRAETVDGDNPRMTSDTLAISVPRYDSMPGIVLEQ